jgi:hypothetical protein
MMENGILSQIYGGCVFKASWVPQEDKKRKGLREIPLKIERYNPKRFYGIPMPGDMFRLSEAWFIKTINVNEARKFGYTGRQDAGDLYLVEYWSPEKFKITINNEVASMLGRKLEGDNPWGGRVPGYYIPHIRIGNFLGVNVIDSLKGLVKEMNLRVADYGDAVNDDAHQYAGLRNSETQQVKTLAPGLPVVDIGTNRGLTGNEPDPDIFEIRKQNKASEAMGQLTEKLLAQYRRDSFVPAVADGEDEGSQRSALTLATRFWPLHAHVRTERIFWTAAMDVMQTDLLHMLNIRKRGGIEEKHLGLRMKQKWPAVLPRDREALINEWVNRRSAGLGSPETFMEQAGDIDDPEAEVEKMLKFEKKMKDIESEIEIEKAKVNANAAARQGNKTTSSGSSETKKPASGSKESS